MWHAAPYYMWRRRAILSAFLLESFEVACYHVIACPANRRKASPYHSRGRTLPQGGAKFADLFPRQNVPSRQCPQLILNASSVIRRVFHCMQRQGAWREQMRSMTKWVLGMEVVGEIVCFDITPRKLRHPRTKSNASNLRFLYTKWPRDEPGRVTSHPTKIGRSKR